MLRKITYYLLILFGFFIITGSIVLYFAIDLSIKDSFFSGLTGLIPIFIALMNKPPSKLRFMNKMPQNIDSKLVMRFRWILLIFILICIFIGTYERMRYKEYKLERNGVEITGIVTGEHDSFIMGTSSHYEFELDGYVYTGIASKPENINIDDSVYITFLPDDPNINNLSINIKR